MAKNSMKPQIRFKGFTDAWEQRKVSNMFKVTRGYVLAATLTSADQATETPYPVFSSQTKDKGLLGYYKDYLYEDAITWTTDGANAGTVNFRAGKFYCTNVCGVLLTDSVKASPAVAEALNNVAKSYVSYVGNPKLMNNVMADIEIYIPFAQTEQEKISQVFTTLDNLITLHQCKRAAFMSRKSPPIFQFEKWRNTLTWEQRKVNSICEKTYGGGTPNTSDREFWSGEIPWIQSSDIVEHNVLDVTVRKRISDKAICSSATQRVPANSIAIITRVGVGKLAFMPFPYTTSQDFLSLSGLRVNALFATYALYVKLQNDMNIVQGTSIKGITKEELLAKEIAVPICPLEQERICTLFKGLDNLITLHQRGENIYNRRQTW